MSLGIAILWISVGAAAGWFGSRIMGTFARPASLPDDDALARWESEGGTTRDGQAEPRPWAVEVAG